MSRGISKKEDFINERTLRVAEHISETGDTIRQAADKFHISKSIIHKDITERLEKLNPALYQKVMKVFADNFKARHLRGGMSTKMRYEGKPCKKILC